MRIFLMCLFIIALISCSDEKKTAFLSPETLPIQLFTINSQNDTVLKTANGALIKIQKGSFADATGKVELKIKEAYTIHDMITAGLTTQTNGNPLRSGGMIYLDAVSDDISISKPIQISIPSESYDGEMKIYKGDLADGKTNWIDPQPLKDSLPPYLLKGKSLFDASCATCHLLNKAATGPALRGTESRGPWQNRNLLFAFTRNPGGFIPKTCYTKELAAQYNGQIMPGFPQLDDEALNAIYGYIKVSDGNKQSETISYMAGPCDDSCYRYDSVKFVAAEELAYLSQERQRLIDSNESRIIYNRLDTNGTILRSNGDDSQFVFIDKVQPEEYKAIYYRFDITSFGWYNIDALLQSANSEAASLTVQVDNSLSDKWDLFIAVPGKKVFDRGGRLTNEKGYGFFTKDGKIPLNKGTKVIVFALGEANEQIAFAYKEFFISGNDLIKLQPKLVTKAEFNQAVKSWSIERVQIQVADSKNAVQIRKTDSKFKNQQDLIESYRPKNCDCNCGLSGDSVQQAITVR